MTETELDPREAAAREEERGKRITEYLRESLRGETRIETPMDSRCEVSVVIPAYAEREGIFRPLLSLARQEGVKPEEYEVIFVVNNPPSEPVRTLDESENDWARKRDLYLMATWQNAQTIEILRFLNGGPMPSHATDEERGQLEEIRSRGTRVHVVDKSGEGRTLPPEEANVGGARNRGVAEAVERFYGQHRKNGIIAQSDADTRFPPNYILSLVRAFGRDPSLVGISGKIEFELSDEVKEMFGGAASTAELFSRYQWVAKALKARKNVLDRKDVPAEEPRVHFSGANMASRAFEAALVGGVPKLAGGEDPAFGFRLAGIGKVAVATDVVAHPLDRFSARTALSAGHGQERLRLKDSLEGEGRLVEHPTVIFIKRQFAGDISRLAGDPTASKEAFRQAATVDGVQLLDDEELQEVVDAVRANMGDLNSSARLRELRGIIDAKLKGMHPDIPIDRAVERLLVEATLDDAVRERYEGALRETYEHEAESAREREVFVRAYAELIRESGIDPLDVDAVLVFLRSHADRLGKTGGADVLRRDPESARKPLQRFGELYRDHPTPDGLVAAVRQAFPELFWNPEENPDRWMLMKLSALMRALE
ncbi:hypothetical protein A2348_05270 [Candidatus Uhrbacteria bacterium RIFOXYB12_FULL_58_10]|uniref:Glycosyltransferase 2-like domain-containing protein n=1 Tax=Candidatus Uhrbacteria bacterium RIFOXYB2_FULL_57_15 TaxID=1802422 RepID=A0A1F7W4M9_9BACT|nr:MAG: hypothetical protein A2348_05270 [Candidatus Uhrbacteria bacterium RIFOXYB12_FULL_58_10]OGL97710.1 MAG: hypothetical protein A2304_00400 [Candidatus Uhrbacteria bacterium RIFOXYB2_FULL_57_15]OGM00035.1 MAG: hypothetical protein A2501_03735 [Candidatus Uhrbacteria bacterium RIFOXYC12_FULL_57_11]